MANYTRGNRPGRNKLPAGKRRDRTISFRVTAEEEAWIREVGMREAADKLAGRKRPPTFAEAMRALLLMGRQPGPFAAFVAAEVNELTGGEGYELEVVAVQERLEREGQLRIEGA